MHCLYILPGWSIGVLSSFSTHNIYVVCFVGLGVFFCRGLAIRFLFICGLFTKRKGYENSAGDGFFLGKQLRYGTAGGF